MIQSVTKLLHTHTLVWSKGRQGTQCVFINSKREGQKLLHGAKAVTLLQNVSDMEHRHGKKQLCGGLDWYR